MCALCKVCCPSKAVYPSRNWNEYSFHASSDASGMRVLDTDGGAATASKSDMESHVGPRINSLRGSMFQVCQPWQLCPELVAFHQAVSFRQTAVCLGTNGGGPLLGRRRPTKMECYRCTGQQTEERWRWRRSHGCFCDRFQPLPLLPLPKHPNKTSTSRRRPGKGGMGMAIQLQAEVQFLMAGILGSLRELRLEAVFLACRHSEVHSLIGVTAQVSLGSCLLCPPPSCGCPN